MANNNKPTVDLPFFELLSQGLRTSDAISTLTTSESGDKRYIYYLSSSSFYRYDTIGDTWQVLENFPITPATLVTMKYTANRGFHGRILSATSTTVTIPSLRGNIFNGETLRILSGPGYGQERVLSFDQEIIHDSGICTAVSSSGVHSITDSTKKWRVNQWAGYTIAINYGTDIGQYKKILYNDATTLYIYNTDLQPHDPWNNMFWVAASPYAIPVATNSNYLIMSARYNLSSAWDTVPDYRSFFTTLTGGIFAFTPNRLFYYDVIHGSWTEKTTTTNIWAASVGTDATIERVPRNAASYLIANAVSGTISSTNRTITQDGLMLEIDRYSNHRIELTNGTGKGQTRRIVAHNANTITVNRNWDSNPSTDTEFKIYPDYNNLWFAGDNKATMLAYQIENDAWLQGHYFDDGVVNSIGATMQGWNPVGVNTGAYIANGVQAINPVPTAAGSNYVIGDVLTCSVGGTGAQVRVTNISASGGQVTGLELIHSGTATGFTTGAGKAITGGTGTGCTIEITTVGPTALITTSSAHWFKTGDAITFTGCNEVAWNSEHTIIGVPGTTTFCVIPTATASMAVNSTQGQATTRLIDSTKNWIENEHAGRIIHMTSSGVNGAAAQVRWIANNSSNTINLASGQTWTAGANGTSKYTIYDAKAFGPDDYRKETTMKAYGWATGGTTASLVDATKNWIPGMWSNYYMKIEAGPGYGSGRILIANNTSNTINFSVVQSFTPDTNTKYEIADSWGFCTSTGTSQIIDANKNWVTNIWSGKRVRFTAGTGVTTESTITTHTGTTLGGVASSDVTTAYTILGNPNLASGIDLISNWGSSYADIKARYLITARGSGTFTVHYYDIPLNKWNYGLFLNGQTEAFTTGSSYAYDGNNTIYMSRTGNAGVVRIMKYNLANLKFDTFATTNWLSGTVTIGNIMETVCDPTGQYQYLYLMQSGGTLFARALVF